MGSTRSISFVRRSLSGTGMCIKPVGDLGSSMVVVAPLGLGNCLVTIWMVRTPCEKQSSLLEYRGGLTSASGGMYACVPGHIE